MSRAKPLIRHAKVSLCPAASFRGRLSKAGYHQAFGFKTVQCRINTSDGDISSPSYRKLSSERNPVRIVPQLDDREKNHQFEFTEIARLAHIFYLSEEI